VIITLTPGPILCVDGVYNNDDLEGRGVITYRNGEKLHCTFEDNSCHGHAVLFDSSGSVKQVSNS
jgi:hypothetical protein